MVSAGLGWFSQHNNLFILLVLIYECIFHTQLILMRRTCSAMNLKPLTLLIIVYITAHQDFKWSELPCNQKYLPSIYPVCHSFCSKCKCKSHPRSDWNSQVMMLEGCSQFNGTRRYFITAFILQCSDSNVILLKHSHNFLLPTSNKDSALTIWC